MTHAPLLAGRPVGADRLNVMNDFDVFVPTLTAPTSPTLGDTFDSDPVQGVWRRRGHQIDACMRFGFGEGSTAGSGSYEVSLPFPPDPRRYVFDNAGGVGSVIGSAFVRKFDDGANSQVVAAQLSASGQGVRMFKDGPSVTIAAGVPFVWGSGCQLMVQVSYLADPDHLPDEPVGQTDYIDGYPIPGTTTRLLDQVRFYSPKLLAATTDPNLGDEGEAEGWYKRCGRWIEGGVRFRFAGADISAGSGTYRIELPAGFAPFPLTSASATPGGGFVMADGRIRDQSTAANSRLVMGVISGTNTDVFGSAPQQRAYLSLLRGGSASYVTHSSPFTWASNDRISLRFAYLTTSEDIGRLAQ